jgi:hypothetical protein
LDREYYDKMRHEVMDEEEIKESEKFLEYFRSSWLDKNNRGLFDKWEMIDTYWEGESNLPESDSDPGSNTNIINPSVEGQVALLVEQNIAIQASPVGPSDVPFADDVRVMLEWVKEKNKMKRKLDVHERRRKKFGTGIFRILFDPTFMNGFGLPDIQPINPAYVFTDPVITDVYKLQEGRFTIEVTNKSVKWAKDNSKFIEDRAEAIIPGYHPLESEWIFGEDEGEVDHISKDSYLHMYIFIREKDGDKHKLRLVEMSGCGVILRDTWKENKDFFPNAKYPYFFTPDMYREGTVWGKSTSEILLDAQDQINDFDDQIRINARLTGNPQRLVYVDSGVDADKVTNEPGLNIPVNPVSNGKPIDWVTPPSMPSYIINRRDRIIDADRQIISRFSDQSAGIRQKGVDTATEALALQQSGASVIDHQKLLLQETLSEVFEYCLDIIKEEWTEEKAFKITEKENEFRWFRGSKLKEIPSMGPASEMYKTQFAKDNPNAPIPDSMLLEESGKPVTKEAEFDITVTVGAGMPNNKAFVYSVMKESKASGDITPEEYRKYLIGNLGLPLDENPPMMQPPAMPNTPPINQSPDIMGMTQGGAPRMPGGVAM